MRSVRRGGLTLTLASLVAAGVMHTSPMAQQPTPGHHQMHLYPLGEVKWGSGLASLPPGAQFAVLEGDPAKEGLFTMRLRLPDGYQIAPHSNSGV